MTLPVWSQDDEGASVEVVEDGKEQPLADNVELSEEEMHVSDKEVIEEDVDQPIAEEEPATEAAAPSPPVARPMPTRPLPARPVVPRSSPVRPSQPFGRPPSSTAAIPKPPPSGDDPLPKNGSTVTEPTTFDFEDTPLNLVVESIARMTGKNFDVDPNIASTRVTIITHDQIPPEMAYEVLESILNSRGFTMVETLDGLLVKIVAIGDLKEKVKLKKGMEGVPDSFDELATHIVKVQYADAGELSTVLSEVGSKSAIISAYQNTNTLIITDTADGLRRIFTLLEEIDIPGFDTDMEIFRLEYARAEVLATQIEEVLMGGDGMGAPGSTRTRTTQTIRRPTPTPTRSPIRPSVPGQTLPTVIGERNETLRIVPDERLNTLIVIATTSLMERVRDLVSKLDTPTPYESNNMNVYPLLNADAEQIETALNAMLGSTPRQASDKAAAQTGEIQPFEKKVMITRYEQNNSLLILASPQDYKLIKEIIAQLDVPQRQVVVEAVIMDVSIQDTYGLTVDAASVTGNDAFALGNTSNLDSLMTAADLATSLSDGTAPISMASALIGLGTTGGLTAGAYDHIDTTINGFPVKIPFVPFLLRALETLTDVDILSQPCLTTQDNEPADIIVGQELPVPSMRSGYSSYDPRTTGTNQTRTPVYGMSSYGGRGINREDVGVKMKVTPHINEGDYVSLETEIEVSEATQSNVGIDANELGPTFNKSKITNNVVVKDGTTAVIGGLIKEIAQHTRNQTPGLGDLPLLGWVFRSKTDTRKKQNVVILITPHIIKDGIDLDRVTDYKMGEFRSANVDVLFEEGFVKKIRKSRQMRNKHRPSVNRSEEMQTSEEFGRGDIKR